MIPFAAGSLDLFDWSVVSVGPQHQPESGIIGKIAHRPVEENYQLVPHIQQEHQVNEHPRKPGQTALERKAGQIDHGLAFADGGHCPLIVIFELDAWQAFYLSFEVPCKMRRLSDGHS